MDRRAVLLALVRAGLTDPALLACVRMDPEADVARALRGAGSPPAAMSAAGLATVDVGPYRGLARAEQERLVLLALEMAGAPTMPAEWCDDAGECAVRPVQPWWDGLVPEAPAPVEGLPYRPGRNASALAPLAILAARGVEAYGPTLDGTFLLRERRQG